MITGLSSESLDSVGRGDGHALTEYSSRYVEEFRWLEREARDQKRGLWREPSLLKNSTTNDRVILHFSLERPPGVIRREDPRGLTQQLLSPVVPSTISLLSHLFRHVSPHL